VRDLSLRQRLFVEVYLSNCGNATDAARRAGYKGSANALGVQGHQNLRNPKIRAAIDERLKQHRMAAEEVLTRLSDIARADLFDFIRTTKKGWEIDLDKAMKSGKTHVIRMLRQGKYGTEIETYDRLRALELIGRYYGLWNRHDRALRRRFLEVMRQKVEGRPEVFSLADLVIEAEHRAEQRLEQRKLEHDGG